MARSKSGDLPEVRLTDRFGEAFRHFQDKIRERAYYLSLHREPGREDSMADWLAAQSELAAPVPMELKEQKKNFIVECQLEGFTAEEIEVEIAGEVLQVFGTHSETHERDEEEGGGTTAQRLSFYQSMPLPAPVDIDHCQAKLFKNGKLKITLPKPVAQK
ncbi:MAG: Hsp20 family protein [Halioglobus sp.]|nr:Hsp20 family protein [Halioglobus sp.]